MIFFFLIGYLLLSVSLFFLFRKASIPGWVALIPGLNFIYWSKLVGRPRGYSLFLLVPIVNIFILSGLAIDLARSFQKLRYLDGLLAVVAMPLYFLFLGFDRGTQYHGAILPREEKIKKQLKKALASNDKKKYKKLLTKNPYRKSWGREWVESLTFGVFAAAFIRIFLVEAYAIPTSSMESSLLVGDRLFVSKAHYGLRLPMTIAMIPLIHNRLPITSRKSYLEHPKLPYHRLPALESIDVGDQIVFNWPVGDSIYVTPERSWSAQQANQIPYVKKITQQARFETHPIDKRDHYVKRCLGVPGDRLQIIDRQVFINGIEIEEPRGLQFKYRLTSHSGTINPRMLERLGVNITDSNFPPNSFHLTSQQVEKIQTIDSKIKVEIIPGHGDHLFPHDDRISGRWTIDNYGPIDIPKAGQQIKITTDNLALYKRIISVYEGHHLSVDGNKIFIDGIERSTYTFAQNYYWGMGDNRHNSEDSRSWGFIPEDHIVGKPIFILFSTKNGSIKKGFNWDRLLSRTSRFN